MKVAVTGATGFVGRHVLGVLAKQGIEPVAISRSAEPTPTGSFVRQLDIADVPANAFEAIGAPDVLIHLAWGGLPNYRSLHHFEQELPAHYAFLSAVVRGGLKSLIVTGTCYEYGMVCGELCEDAETSPSNPYAFAKDTLRRQLEQLRAAHPFALTWARLFYMFGDGQAPTSVLPLLRAAAERCDPTFPMSGGEQLRDYLPVEAVAEAIVALALKRPDAGTVNICSGRPISIRRLVEDSVQSNGWNIRLDLGRYPYVNYEPHAFWGSRARLDQLLLSNDP